MTLTQLKTLARAYVPGASLKVIDDTVLELILNNGVVEVANLSICLKTNKTFAVVADQREYALSNILGNFLTMDDSGVYWYDGASWKQLYPKTTKWLDERRPNWRDEASGDPMYYYQESDTLGFHPIPDTSLADGFKIYYGRKPVAMTDGSHYPFEQDTELTHLTMFDEAILYYWKWKVLPALNKDNQDNYRLAENAFKNEVSIKMSLLNRRPDMSASRYTRMQGPRIGR